MKNVLILSIGMAMLFTACVPQRKFQDLETSHAENLKAKTEAESNLRECREQESELRRRLKGQADTITYLNKDTSLLGSTNRKLNMLYTQTNDAYERLLDKEKEIENRNTLRTQELSTELKDVQRKLNEKEVELTRKETDLKRQENNSQKLQADLKILKTELDELQKDLQMREKRVKELSQVLSQKDSAVQALRTTISNSLLSYRDKGLTVNVKNGKVYVSVEDKLLFESGKYQVNTTGQQAILELAKALNEQGDISILVEGHTDNVPLKGTGTIKDNWDLSVLRATEVVRILTRDGKVQPNRITAAGRGESQPVASNDTAEGKAKNRRTEIILTPQLGELFKILETH